MLSSPEIYEVIPSQSGTANLLATIPDVTGLFEMTEYAPDQYAFIAGNYSIDTRKSTYGSYSIYTIDMTQDSPQPTKVLDVLEAEFLESLTTFTPPSDRHGKTTDIYLLAGDAQKGMIFLVNLSQKSYKPFLQDSTMNPIPIENGGHDVGILSMKVKDNRIYYVSRDQDLFASIPIPTCWEDPLSTITTRSTANATIISSGYGLQAFEFSNSDESEIYLVGDSTLYKFNESTKQTTDVGVTLPAGQRDLLLGDTFGAYGRTVQDSRILYVSTNGGLIQNDRGLPIVGARMVAVDTTNL